MSGANRLVGRVLVSAVVNPRFSHGLAWPTSANLYFGSSLEAIRKGEHTLLVVGSNYIFWDADILQIRFAARPEGDRLAGGLA